MLCTRDWLQPTSLLPRAINHVMFQLNASSGCMDVVDEYLAPDSVVGTPDLFGGSVALVGEFAVIGATSALHNAISNVGGVYLYRLDRDLQSLVWLFRAIPPTATLGTKFGT